MLIHFGLIYHLHTPSKPKVYLRFQGLQKRSIGLKRVRYGFDYPETPDLQVCNIIKKRIQHNFFPMNFAKFEEHHIFRTSAN